MLHRYDVPDLWVASNPPVGALYHEQAIAPDALRVMLEEATEVVVRRHPEGKVLARKMRREGSRGGIPRRFVFLAPFVLEALCRQHGFRARVTDGKRTARRAGSVALVA
jgi:hypothetical protein